MSKVLIIGPHYFNFLSAVDSAFRNLGYDTSVLGYDTPVHHYNSIMKLRWKLSPYRNKLFEDGRDTFCLEAIHAFQQFNPDFVFIINGEALKKETILTFKELGAKTVLWFFDNLCNLHSFVTSFAEDVDAVFSFDQKDVDTLSTNGCNSHFLPQACDRYTYYPLDDVRKDIDILFIGNMFYSKRRRDIMLTVIKAFPKMRISVYGLFFPWYKGPVRWLKRPYKSIFKNRMVSPEEANLLYNQAKIVLNIHQEAQVDGANPKVFEISGSGAFQICDRNPYVEHLFPSGSVDFYDSDDELIEIINHRIHNDNSESAAIARKIVNECHTFENRIVSIMKEFDK